jgi:hypothetical protein
MSSGSEPTTVVPSGEATTGDLVVTGIWKKVFKLFFLDRFSALAAGVVPARELLVSSVAARSWRTSGIGRSMKPKGACNGL